MSRKQSLYQILDSVLATQQSYASLEGNPESLRYAPPFDDITFPLIEQILALEDPQNVEDVRRLPDSVREQGLCYLLSRREDQDVALRGEDEAWCADWYIERAVDQSAEILSNAGVQTVDDLVLVLECAETA